MSEKLSIGILELKRDEVVEAVRGSVQQGADPIGILEECRRGMSLVGERFQNGEYFLAELLLAAEIFKEATALLEPHVATAGTSEPLGKVLLATMKGDIHDLGKNIVATLLRAYGFDVYDLGVDVPAAALVERVEEIKPEFVGFSALLTTAFASMKEATHLLVQARLRHRIKLLVGGGVTSPAVKEYVGADFQTVDAMEGVVYCLGIAGQERHG
jgi:methanogenic corrinoid protein MtbC1